MSEKYIYYTDGAATMKQIDSEYVRCAGGWAWARVDKDLNVISTGTDGDSETTNNAMELTAIREALKDFSNCIEGKEFGETIEINSDSAYSINVLTNWAFSWEKNGWTRGKKHEPIENLELIKEIFYLIKRLKDTGNTVEFIKVKGHSGVEVNELVDKLAVSSKEKYLAVKE